MSIEQGISLKPVASPERRSKIMQAIGNYDVSRTQAWNDLDSLSSRTVIEAIDANPEGVFETAEGGFVATATVYVTLHYGDKRDALASSDAFPALVSGRITNGEPQIDSFEVDTSSFYEGQGEASAFSDEGPFSGE